MAKRNTYTLIALLVLTGLTSLFASINSDMVYIPIAIMVLSGVKFLLVAFQFIELKKAHVFWKGTLILFLIIFVTLIIGSR